MPVRDGARWLGEAIASIQGQTLSDLELIIIDDGSADDSPHIIDAHSRRDSRIVAIRQERLGLVTALNRGLAESRGQLIARLDADDIAKPQRLERQSQYLEKHPEIGLLGTWAEKIDERGSVRGILTPPTQAKELAALLTRTNPFLHSSIMMRKTVLQTVGFYRVVFEGAEDYDLWMRMSEVSDTANMPEYLLQYRLHPTSVSHSARVRQLFSARLAQRAAQARRASAYDPTSELVAPPNWHTTDTVVTPIYADLTRLFCLLDVADSANIPSTKGRHIDVSPLRDRNLLLNHAERRMAQLALLNLLRNNVTTEIPRAILLWHFIRLHPFRAINLGYRALWKH
jgi:glycosyltransferase involved in cell wall biosynthesis